VFEMAQTRMAGGDADLLGIVTHLIEGACETPLWTDFLSSLRCATSADYAILIFDPPGRPMDEGLQLACGCDPDSSIAGLIRACIRASMQRRPAEEGRVTSLEHLFHPGQAKTEPSYSALTEELGIVGIRLFRVSEPRGVDGWLVLGRTGCDLTKQDEAVLSALVRPLRATLRSHVAAESDKFRSAMAAEAVRRLQCGWLLLDRGGYILATDHFGDAVLASSGILARTVGGRISINVSKLEREVLQTVADLADKPGARPRAISLRSDPWLDMLLVPERKKMLKDTAVPAVIAYVHGDNWHSADRCSQLCDMFELGPSEARLALALCRGKSIAEAAQELGLALETARSYTKSIYAKTGTRGMADLVRVVMGSVLTLAPDV
jgi:DNA-binding CsgD family transcriptional regulator